MHKKTGIARAILRGKTKLEGGNTIIYSQTSNYARVIVTKRT